jgi:hypothetical protein
MAVVLDAQTGSPEAAEADRLLAGVGPWHDQCVAS